MDTLAASRGRLVGLRKAKGESRPLFVGVRLEQELEIRLQIRERAIGGSGRVLRNKSVTLSLLPVGLSFLGSSNYFWCLWTHQVDRELR